MPTLEGEDYTCEKVTIEYEYVLRAKSLVIYTGNNCFLLKHLWCGPMMNFPESVSSIQYSSGIWTHDEFSGSVLEGQLIGYFSLCCTLTVLSNSRTI